MSRRSQWHADVRAREPENKEVAELVPPTAQSPQAPQPAETPPPTMVDDDQWHDKCRELGSDEPEPDSDPDFNPEVTSLPGDEDQDLP
jgi:hypothetical protein